MVINLKIRKNINKYRENRTLSFINPQYTEFEKEFGIGLPDKLRKLYDFGVTLNNCCPLKITIQSILEIQYFCPFDENAIARCKDFNLKYFEFAVSGDGDGILLDIFNNESEKLYIDYNQENDIDVINMNLSDILVQF